MKLIHFILLSFAAGYLSGSGPDGNSEPQGKQKKEIVTDTLQTNLNGSGPAIQVEFIKGKAHNHPLFAVWAEDTEGNYIQTLYVSRSIATSIFNYGDKTGGTWTKGVVRRPAALPCWSHKRGIKASDGLYVPLPEDPVPDAYSGPTPKNSFLLETRFDQPAPEEFYIFLEVNQPWDWNEYWTNNKYPDDEDYKASSQPAVVYRALISQNDGKDRYAMELIGHSHYSGKDGSINTDVSTLSTALEIVDRIDVMLVP